MYHLRRVVHALGYNDPRPGRHYRVKLNPWQQHYLLHYETLDPFPVDLRSEEEVFVFMWGDDWKAALEFQENATFLNLPLLTTYARQFGFSFGELWFFLRSFQTIGNHSTRLPSTTHVRNSSTSPIEYSAKSALTDTWNVPKLSRFNVRSRLNARGIRLCPCS